MKALMVILLLFITNTVAQNQPYRNQYQYIRLNFDELMSTQGLFDKDNYVCYDETGDTVIIYGVGYDTRDDTTGGIKYSILATEQWKYNVYYTIKVSWVKDRAGNLIAENNYAFTLLPLVDPNNYKPTVEVNSNFYTIDTLLVDTVWASGQENAEHGPEKAVDGISYTTPGSNINLHCWTSCCIATVGGQWFIAGWEKEHFIKDIILSGTYYYTGRVYGLEIQISSNGTNWETIDTFNTLPNIEWTTYSLGRKAKYIKIKFLSNSTITSDWAGLWEIKFVGN